MLSTRSAPSRIDGDGRGEPGGGHGAGHAPVLAGRLEHGDGVVAAAGHVQRLAVGRERGGTGLAAERGIGEGGDLDIGARSSVAVSTMETESEWPLETASSFSSGLRIRCEGARPTGTSLTARVSASITLRVPETVDPVTGSVATSEPLEGATVSFAARAAAAAIGDVDPAMLFGHRHAERRHADFHSP